MQSEECKVQYVGRSGSPIFTLQFALGTLRCLQAMK